MLMDTKFGVKDQFDKSIYEYFQIIYQYLQNIDERISQSKNKQSNVNDNDNDNIRGRVVDIEKKLDLTKLSFSNEIGDIKASLKAKYESINKNFQSIGATIEDLHTQNSRPYKEIGPIKRDELFSKFDPEVVSDLKSKVIKLEGVVADYLKIFIEPEALSRAQKIVKPYVLINEKFDCLMFLIKNYKLLNPALIVNSLQNFKNLLTKHNYK